MTGTHEVVALDEADKLEGVRGRRRLHAWSLRGRAGLCSRWGGGPYGAHRPARHGKVLPFFLLRDGALTDGDVHGRCNVK